MTSTPCRSATCGVRRSFTRASSGSRSPRGPAHAVVFATQPIPFAIREPNIDLAASEKLGWGVALWFACDEVEALYDECVAAGVPVLASLADGDFGRFFIIADPDGYALTIHEGRR